MTDKNLKLTSLTTKFINLLLKNMSKIYSETASMKSKEKEK
jgi:hypothetical protein